MDFNEFISTVKKLTNPNDFFKNEHLLSKVNEWDRDAFINCLRIGNDICEATETIKTLFRLTTRTALDQSQIFELLPDMVNLVYSLGFKSTSN